MSRAFLLPDDEILASQGFLSSAVCCLLFLGMVLIGCPRARSFAESVDDVIDIPVARFSSLSNCYFGNLREAPLTEKKIRYRYWCIQVTPNLKIQIVPC